MQLNTGHKSIEMVAETDDELDLILALTVCVKSGGWIRALPDDEDIEGVQLAMDGDPSGGVSLN